jgi:hypothetical protein
MLTSPKTPIPLPKLLEEQRMKEERMHDVLLLLQHLVEREETTVRMILDCLYDVGSVNLINQKITIKPANRLMKGIASLSKPAFRMVALRWFKANCPLLITKWLQSKVRF